MNQTGNNNTVQWDLNGLIRNLTVPEVNREVAAVLKRYRSPAFQAHFNANRETKEQFYRDYFLEFEEKELSPGESNFPLWFELLRYGENDWRFRKRKVKLDDIVIDNNDDGFIPGDIMEQILPAPGEEFPPGKIITRNKLYSRSENRYLDITCLYLSPVFICGTARNTNSRSAWAWIQHQLSEMEFSIDMPEIMQQAAADCFKRFLREDVDFTIPDELKAAGRFKNPPWKRTLTEDFDTVTGSTGDQEIADIDELIEFVNDKQGHRYFTMMTARFGAGEMNAPVENYFKRIGELYEDIFGGQLERFKMNGEVPYPMEYKFELMQEAPGKWVHFVPPEHDVIEPLSAEFIQSDLVYSLPPMVSKPGKIVQLNGEYSLQKKFAFDIIAVRTSPVHIIGSILRKLDFDPVTIDVDNPDPSLTMADLKELAEWHCILYAMTRGTEMDALNKQLMYRFATEYQEEIVKKLEEINAQLAQEVKSKNEK